MTKEKASELLAEINEKIKEGMVAAQIKSIHHANWKVYLLTFPDGMQYIGTTKRPITNRQGKDGSGYKNQKSLKRLIDAWGWENVRMDVLLEGILTKNMAGSVEKLMIAKYNTLWPFGCNRQNGGFDDIHMVAENSYPVKQIDPGTKEVVRMWRNLAWAEKCGKGKRGQNLNRHRISECCNGVKYRKLHGDWAWEKATWEEYKDYYLKIVKPSFPIAICFR